jgi:hypothetical protein
LILLHTVMASIDVVLREVLRDHLAFEHFDLDFLRERLPLCALDLYTIVCAHVLKDKAVCCHHGLSDEVTVSLEVRAAELDVNAIDLERLSDLGC